MMKRFSFGTLLLAFIGNLAVSANALDSTSSNLTVNIDRLKNQNGQICLSLFSDSRGFPSDGTRALQAKCIDLAEETSTITFQNLRPGSYAVAAFHDVNEDGIFNLNSLGIPKEGFGFSRNPKILTGPPKFGDVVLIIVGPKNNIRIELQYL